MRRTLGAVLFWLAIWLLAGCAHKLRSHQTATRTEETRTEWNDTTTTATQASSTSEKVEAARKVRRRTVTKPDGTKIVTETTEDRGSTVAVYTHHAAAAQSASSGGDFRLVRVSSSSTKASDTRTALPWFRIGVVAGLALVALGWYFVKKWRSRLRLSL